MIPKSILNYNIEKLNKSDEEKTKKLREELKNYNMFDFLSRISSLIIIPENQSKSVIFQLIISTALSLKTNEFNPENIISNNKFKYFINEFSNLNRKKLIDPPDFPFVLPVIYYENYNLFMGTNTIAPYYLNYMLKILSVHKNDFESDAYNKINKIVNGLLNVSEFIFESLNINFNDLKSFSKDIDMKLCSSNIMKDNQKIVTFDEEEMTSLFGKYYEELVIEFGEINISKINDFDNQKYYHRPFIKYENKYILADSTIIIRLIMDILVKFFLSSKINFLKEYNYIILKNLQKDFSCMGFQLLSHKQYGLEFQNNEFVEESLYMCGNDIYFYNIVLFDDGNDYETNKEYKCKIKKNYISQQIKKVKNKLRKRGIEENKIIVIVTPTTIGRDMLYAITLKSNKSLLILSPYEITTIRINEAKEDMFLYKYITARNRLKYYEKSLFVELNLIALFSKRDKSFYLGDDQDSKESILFFIGEYTSDYILESYNKRGYHIADFSETTLLEVMKKDDGISFSPGLLYKQQINNLIEVNKFNIWVLSEENINNSLYYITNLIIDFISYWLSQFTTIFKDLNGIFKINVHCDSTIHAMSYDKSIQEEKILFNFDNKQIDIIFKRNSMDFFNCSTNDKEKEFISNIINIMCEMFQISYPSELVNEVFNNKYKKKIIVLNSEENTNMYPFNDECTLHVSNAISNLILDDVGLYLKNVKKIGYGKIDDYKILNNIVGYLYSNILNKIKKYNKQQLINFLYLEFEKNLSSLLIRQAYYVNDVACYPKRAKEIEENIIDLNRTSVALKFIIELVSSIKIEGTKELSIYELEYILTEASTIIDYAYTCDIYNYDMTENTLTFLNSNRLGYNKDFLIRVNHILTNAKIGRMAAKTKDKRKMISKYDKKINDIPGFEEAFEDEFKFTFKDFTEVTISLLEIAENKNSKLDTLYSTDLKEIKEHVNGKVNDESVERIISYLSQVERDNYLIPPEPYRNVDVFPWRNNRELSLNRKPLIAYNNKIIFGYRALLNAIYFLFEIINNATLKARSKKMKIYLGHLNKESGKNFNEKVYEYLCTFPNSIVDKNVSKIGNIRIIDTNNNTLGDVDILFISKKTKRIIVCEVKNFELSRNMYELYNEYHNMFDPNNEKSFYNKHMKRVEWCKKNVFRIVENYNLEKKKWKVDYCFIVNEPLISNKAMKININVYTIEDVDKFIK